MHRSRSSDAAGPSSGSSSSGSVLNCDPPHHFGRISPLFASQLACHSPTISARPRLVAVRPATFTHAHGEACEAGSAAAADPGELPPRTTVLSKAERSERAGTFFPGLVRSLSRHAIAPRATLPRRDVGPGVDFATLHGAMTFSHLRCGRGACERPRRLRAIVSSKVFTAISGRTSQYPDLLVASSSER